MSAYKSCLQGFGQWLRALWEAECMSAWLQVYGERRRALQASDLSTQMVEYAEKTVDDIVEVGYHLCHASYGLCSGIRVLCLGWAPAEIVDVSRIVHGLIEVGSQPHQLSVDWSFLCNIKPENTSLKACDGVRGFVKMSHATTGICWVHALIMTNVCWVLSTLADRLYQTHGFVVTCMPSLKFIYSSVLSSQEVRWVTTCSLPWTVNSIDWLIEVMRAQRST